MYPQNLDLQSLPPWPFMPRMILRADVGRSALPSSSEVDVLNRPQQHGTGAGSRTDRSERRKSMAGLQHGSEGEVGQKGGKGRVWGKGAAAVELRRLRPSTPSS